MIQPATTLRARVGTANIKNFPDMTDPQVRADAEESGSLTDICLWQEIQEKADHTALHQMLPDFYITTGIGTPFGVRRGLMLPIGKPEVVELSPSLGAGRRSPARYMTRQRFSVPSVPGFPQVEVQSIHYVQAAWSKRAVWNRPLRQKNWKIAHAKQGTYVLNALADGCVVIAGGDFNRLGSDIPKWHESQQWIVGGTGGIDHVALLTPPSVKATMVGAQVTRDLNSDHDLKVRTVDLTLVAPPAPAPAVSPGWDAIYEAADAVLQDTPPDAGVRRADLKNIMHIAARWSVEH